MNHACAELPHRSQAEVIGGASRKAKRVRALCRLSTIKSNTPSTAHRRAAAQAESKQMSRKQVLYYIKQNTHARGAIYLSPRYTLVWPNVRNIERRRRISHDIGLT